MDNKMTNINSNNDSNSKYFTRGGQITFHNWRMLLQINKAVGKLYLWSMLFLTLLILYVITPYEILINSFYYWYAHVLHVFGKDDKIFKIFYHGRAYLENVSSILQQPYFKLTAQKLLHYVFIGFGISLIVGIICAYLMARWLTQKGKKQTESQFIRGSRLGTPKDVSKQIYKDKLASDIKIDGFPLLKNSEVQHLLIHGTTGSGKGQLIMKLLDHSPYAQASSEVILLSSSRAI